MMRWITWWVVGMLALSLLIFGFDADGGVRTSRVLTPASSVASDARNALQSSALETQMWRTVDSVVAALAHELPDGGVRVAGPDGLEIPARPHMESLLQARVAAHQTAEPTPARSGPTPRMGYFFVDARQYFPEDVGEPWTAEGLVIAGSDAGHPFCIQTQSVRTDRTDILPMGSTEDAEARYTALAARVDPGVGGTCMWVEEYGLPGPTVAAWLRTLNGQPAAPPSPLVLAGLDPGSRNLAERRLEFRPCLSGATDLCGRALADGMSRYRSGRQPVIDPALAEMLAEDDAIVLSYRPNRAFDAYRFYEGVLSDLESDFGPDALQSFWASSEDFGVAFRVAFGTTHGEWFAARMTRMLGTTRRGPRFGLDQAGFLLLAVGIGLFGSGITQRRKRAG